MRIFVSYFTGILSPPRFFEIFPFCFFAMARQDQMPPCLVPLFWIFVFVAFGPQKSALTDDKPIFLSAKGHKNKNCKKQKGKISKNLGGDRLSVK